MPCSMYGVWLRSCLKTVYGYCLFTSTVISWTYPLVLMNFLWLQIFFQIPDDLVPMMHRGQIRALQADMGQLNSRVHLWGQLSERFETTILNIYYLTHGHLIHSFAGFQIQFTQQNNLVWHIKSWGRRCCHISKPKGNFCVFKNLKITVAFSSTVTFKVHKVGQLWPLTDYFTTTKISVTTKKILPG